jgi:DNA-binding transcriptional regulator YiaG
MDIEAFRVELDLKPEEFARALGVSSGHAADLRSGRRRPSLPIAAKLDQLAGAPRFLPEILARKMTGNAA